MASSSKSLPATLSALAAAEQRCKRCSLYKNALQVVPGCGPAAARLMLLGEQPGNDEDIAGKPFVGPAGRVLDAALLEVGLDRDQLFITNAVKHFKFSVRGKRRLHRRPNAEEIAACIHWNFVERSIVEPRLIVALGATAVRSLLDRPATTRAIRGRVIDLKDGGKMLATIHPSWLLRIRDSSTRSLEKRRLAADLALARDFVG